MPYEVALILLYDTAGRVLLQHRTDDAPVLPGHWAFFGGQINERESPLEAVKREAFEELSYRVREPRLLFTQEFSEGPRSGRLHVFTQLFSGEYASLRLNEGQGWGWYGESAVDALKMVERDKRILKILWEHLRDEKVL